MFCKVRFSVLIVLVSEAGMRLSGPFQGEIRGIKRGTLFSVSYTHLRAHET